MTNHTTTEYRATTSPTAWKSAPGFVRFAVWLWSIGVVLGLVVGTVVALALASQLG